MLHLLGRELSLVLGPVIIFGNVSLLIGMDNTFTRAEHYIY